MIEEVVSSIIEAEDAARQMIEQAEHQAAQIVAEAEYKAEMKAKQAAEANKNFFSKEMQFADGETTSKAQAYIAENKKTVDADLAKFNNNTQKAVQFILENIK